MGCCQYFSPTEGGANTYTVRMPVLTFGRGCLAELGARAAGAWPETRRAVYRPVPGRLGAPGEGAGIVARRWS